MATLFRTLQHPARLPAPVQQQMTTNVCHATGQQTDQGVCVTSHFFLFVTCSRDAWTYLSKQHH